jgi:hypothetical protein
MTKRNRDYKEELADIRSMMERSSKYKPLIGLSGIFAGSYALAGVIVATQVLDFNPVKVSGPNPDNIGSVAALAVFVLVLALATIIILSRKKSDSAGQLPNGPALKQLITAVSFPLLSGALLSLVLLSHELSALIAPATLVFYGLALVSAARFTYNELQFLGSVDILLGLTGFLFPSFGMFLWAIGFGVLHLVYGTFMHYRYER